MPEQTHSTTVLTAAEAAALLPRHVSDDFGGWHTHVVDWNPETLIGRCGDCSTVLTPDDIRLSEDVAAQVEAAARAAGLIGSTR